MQNRNKKRIYSCIEKQVYFTSLIYKRCKTIVPAATDYVISPSTIPPPPPPILKLYTIAKH